jgi:hypothetical protein
MLAVKRNLTMKGFTAISSGLLILAAAYCGSYFVLRCAGMRFGAHRRDVRGVSRVTTYVYFGNGDNRSTRLARVVFLPMHRAEHAWLCLSRAVVVYE